MGKFFNGKVKRDRTSLIKYTVIGIGVLIIVILLFAIGCQPHENYDELIKVKDKGVTIEIGDYYPEVLDYFKEVDEYPYADTLKYSFDKDDCDTSKVMTCKVTITGSAISDIKTKLYIKDTTVPDLTLRESLNIDVNEPYNVEDFVEYCEDNSGEDCIIHYYDPNGTVTDGEITEDPVDYSSYTKNGTYKILIVAEDVNGNKTQPQETELIIGSGDPSDTTCSFGNMKVSSTRVKFPIAVYVGDEDLDCAIDKDLWDNATIQVPANNMYKEDYARLQEQLADILRTNYPAGANIKVYPSYISVLNDKLTGLVGYGIFVKVYVAELNKQIDLDQNLVMSYYINPDGSRLYIANKFQVGE